MRQFENKTILNDFITRMNQTMGSVNEQTQMTTAIINSISNSKKRIKPLRNPKLCNYPNSARKDDFNYSEGLGSVSMQGSIDALNNFKQMCIKTIKTKFEAMGPEASKDANLAIGATTVIKEVLEAAKCFTQIVKNINNLVDSYIQSIVKMTTFATNIISQLGRNITDLKQTVITQGRLSSLISVALLDQLNKTTDILLILSLVSEIQSELNAAQLELDYLSNSKERAYLTLDASLALLRNRIDNFLRYSLLLNSLNKNAEYASSLYMTDNFLDDFNLQSKEASCFNWSLTNNSALGEYNLYDELNIIPQLNSMFKNYKSKVTSTVMPLIIASHTENGYIVMPELENSLISCGIDSSLGSNVGLVLELSINHGETLLRAIARGGISNEDGSIKQELGKFITKGIDNIEYTTSIAIDSYNWKIVTDLNTNRVNIGDKYTFYDPIVNSEWEFTYTDDITAEVYSFPVLFEVIDKTHNTVSVRALEEGVDFTLSNYITSTHTFTYNNTHTSLLSLDADNKYQCVTKINNQYVLADASNIPIQIDIDVSNPTGRLRYMTTADLDPDPGLTDETALTWTSGIYTVLKYDIYSFLLKKYNSNSVVDAPHAGEKIPCLNWSLSVYPIGEESAINRVKFSGVYPTDTISTFFLKGHWGFIPETISTATIAKTTQQDKQIFINNRFFHIDSTNR